MGGGALPLPDPQTWRFVRPSWDKRNISELGHSDLNQESEPPLTRAHPRSWGCPQNTPTVRGALHTLAHVLRYTRVLRHTQAQGSPGPWGLGALIRTSSPFQDFCQLQPDDGEDWLLRL